MNTLMIILGFCVALVVLDVGHKAFLNHRKPPITDTSIPYCYSQGHSVYLPCMYSSKEYRA